MSSRSDRGPRRPALVLAMCALALGLHFVGESLAVDIAPASPLTTSASPSADPGHDLAEDQFVLSSPLALPVESGSPWIRPTRPPSAGLTRLAPPAPPPNHQ